MTESGKSNRKVFENSSKIITTQVTLLLYSSTCSSPIQQVLHLSISILSFRQPLHSSYLFQSVPLSLFR